MIKYTPVAVLVFTLVGLVLRLFEIGFHGLWNDELFSVAVSDPDNSFKNVFISTVRDVHPPFYQIILWLWYKLAGFYELSGRYLSVIFGVMNIPAMYMLGRRFFSQKVGLIASFLVTINFFEIFYSQENRSYALLSLLTTLSFIFYHDTQEGKKNSFWAYAVILGMLVNTHFFGYLPALAQALLILINRKYIKRYIFVAMFVVVTILPTLQFILLNAARDKFWIKEPEPLFFYNYFQNYFGQPYLAKAFFLLSMTGLVLLVKKQRRTGMIFTIWIIACLLFPYLKSTFSTPILTPRNTIVVLSAYILLSSYFLSFIKFKYLQLAFLLALIFLSYDSFYLERKLYKRHTLSLRDVVLKTIEKQKKEELLLLSLKPKRHKVYFDLLDYPVEIKKIRNVHELKQLSISSFRMIHSLEKDMFDPVKVENEAGYTLSESYRENGRGIMTYSRGK